MLDITKRVRKLPVPIRPYAEPTRRIDLFQLEMYLDRARRSAEADDFDLRPTTQMRAVVPVIPTAPRERLPYAIVVAAAVTSIMLVVFASGCGVETYVADDVPPAVEDPEIPARVDYFCPDEHVTRRETARHVEKLKRGYTFQPPAAANVFHDVERTTVEAAWIEQMYRDGVTRGVTSTLFAPDIAVTREQIATFVARALYGKDFQRAGTSRFKDVTNPYFIGYIEQLAEDGIMTGCTETQFCPHDKVTRAELATVLVRASMRGAAPPQGTSRFLDAVDHPAESYIEHAVASGLVEGCDKALAPPALREGEPGFEGVLVTRPSDAFVGWLPDTADYGEYVVSRDKRWWNRAQRQYCGGDYGVTLTLDIGEVSYRGIYVKSATFTTDSTKHVAQWSQIPVEGKFYPVSDEGIDDDGLPYRSYRIEAWVGSELALRQIFMPYDAYEWSGELSDAADPAWCGMDVDYKLVRP